MTKDVYEESALPSRTLSGRGPSPHQCPVSSHRSTTSPVPCLESRFITSPVPCLESQVHHLTSALSRVTGPPPHQCLGSSQDPYLTCALSRAIGPRGVPRLDRGGGGGRRRAPLLMRLGRLRRRSVHWRGIGADRSGPPPTHTHSGGSLTFS